MSTHGITPGQYALLRDLFLRHHVTPVIYGSRALGLAHDYSDIDLAVTDEALSVDAWQALREGLEALPLIYKVDLVWLPELHDPAFIEKILKESRPFL